LGQILWKRTNFGIPNEINVVRFSVPRRATGNCSGTSSAVAVNHATGRDLPTYDLDCGSGMRQNAPKWRADRKPVLASVTCW
jgi:hypothetical protein